MRRVGRSWWIPLLAVVALVGSGSWMVLGGAGHDAGVWGGSSRGGLPADGPGSMMGGGWQDGSMMGSGGGLRSRGEDARIGDLAAARTAAAEFAGYLGEDSGVGEVMQFDNQYYAEIVGADGKLSTEVLVDPRSGDVQVEYGPARMWNTRSGMMTGAAANGPITADEAIDIATGWLAARGELTADEAEAFPGYYTLHTLQDGEVEGMLSVNGSTGEVWYHTWHGTSVAMAEAP